MTDKLPHQLLALFAPRPPLRWVPPVDHAPEERRTVPVSGLAQFLPALKEYKNNDGFVPTESWLQRRDRKAAEHKAEVEKNLIEGPKACECFLSTR
jgi:U1 small nuclear ribonucleoprotein 70kDa